MKFRNEWKHEITYSDMLILTARLRAVCKPEEHGVDGKYHIRSLYFDDPFDTALKEKIDGVNMRLEKKSKISGMCHKVWVPIHASEAERILCDDLSWMKDDQRELVRELYLKMKTKGLHPKTIVDYTREAYVFPAGNVRVTLDYDIRTGLQSVDFLNRGVPTVPVNGSPIILEVKWDEYLPDIIRDAVQLPGRRSAAFSKYAACRIYG